MLHGNGAAGRNGDDNRSDSINSQTGKAVDMTDDQICKKGAQGNAL